MRFGFSIGFRGYSGFAASDGGDDVTAPAYVSAAVSTDGLTLTLTYGEALDEASEPATSAYSVSAVSGTVSSVNVSGSTVALGMSSPIYAADLPRVTYVPPGSGKVRDLAGNNAAALSSVAVTNSSTTDPADYLAVYGATQLLGWHDAAHTSLTGSAIDALTDRSGHGNNFTASGTARPTVVAADATLSSLATADFDGSNDQMAAAGLTFNAPSDSNRILVTILMKQDAFTAGRNCVADVTSACCVVQMGTTAAGRMQQNNGTARNDNTGLGGLATWGQVEAYFTGTSKDCLVSKGRLISADASSGTNGPSTGRKLGTNSGGTSFANKTMRETLHVANPTLKQICQMRGLVAAQYGAGVLS